MAPGKHPKSMEWGNIKERSGPIKTPTQQGEHQVM